MDLTKTIVDQAEGKAAKSDIFENLLNTLQFSFAMNFDEESLWLKLYQTIKHSLANDD